MFSELIHKREFNYSGIDALFWLKADTGAFVGPKADWETSHADKFIKYCKKREMVVCAGGNQGMYPRLFSDLFNYVVTFEPDPVNFYVLNLNCQKENIVKLQSALGEKASHIVVNRNVPDNVGMHTVCSEGNGAIPMLSLDSMSFPTVDLIQLDVEGYEFSILRGSVNTINKHKPIITCENASPEIEDFLKNLQYDKVDQSVADSIFKFRE